MNDYVLGAGVAFVLFGMGLTALILGGINFFENKKSKCEKDQIILLSSQNYVL